MLPVMLLLCACFVSVPGLACLADLLVCLG